MNLATLKQLSKFSKGVTIVAALVLAIAVFASIFRVQLSERNGKSISYGSAPGVAPAARSLGDASGMMGTSGDMGMGMEKAMKENVPTSASVVLPEESQSVSVSVGSAAGEDRRVVRDGAVSMRVEDAEWSADEIGRIAERFGGFVASRTMSGDVPGYMMPMVQDEWSGVRDARLVIATEGAPKSGTVVVKVPSEKFTDAVSAIRGIAKAVLNESSSTNDVTEVYVDLEAQLKNKYAEEEAFTKILNTNAQKVSDILEVTRELSRVRGEIDQLEARKKYMDSQTDMASITVSLSEDPQIGNVSNDWRPWQTVKDAVNRLLLHFHGFIDGAIYFVVSVLPLFLLYLLGLYIAYRVGRNVYLKIRG